MAPWKTKATDLEAFHKCHYHRLYTAADWLPIPAQTDAYVLKILFRVDIFFVLQFLTIAQPLIWTVLCKF